ncbi:MAG: hypothetical protein IJ905_15005 [Fibrobacter sp.]|nr:hypothetical protein [Fibrobacter sp.]
MRNIISLVTLFAAIIFTFTSCGDDGASASPKPKYTLDETNQQFSIIYDLCYVTSNSTRWDEYVYTRGYGYEILHDTLLLFKGSKSTDINSNIKVEREGEPLVLISNNADGIYGTWKEISKDFVCNYEDGVLECERGKDDKLKVFRTLTITHNSLAFSWEKNKKYCFGDDFDDYWIEEFLQYDLNMELDDVSIQKSGCNTAKFKANGISVKATGLYEINSDNVAIETVTFESKDKTCTYTSKHVQEEIQYPESLCNLEDISKYVKKKANKHIYEFSSNEQYTNKFIPCVANMLGIDINSDK